MGGNEDGAEKSRAWCGRGLCEQRGRIDLREAPRPKSVRVPQDGARRLQGHHGQFCIARRSC